MRAVVQDVHVVFSRMQDRPQGRLVTVKLLSVTPEAPSVIPQPLRRVCFPLALQGRPGMH